MPLSFPNGEKFSDGAMPYEYRPATHAESTPRIVLTIAIGSFETSAFVDTGGVYFICAPQIARRLQLTATGVVASEKLRWRNRTLSGVLHRIPVTFYASEGASLTIEVTAFVPVIEPEEWNDELPCVLGMSGCLERLRFAVDPSTNTFYFGELASN